MRLEKPQKNSFDPLKPAYFVTAKELESYEDAERVYDDRGRLVHHGRGKFIYRLRGRDRQKSASYYTPEVLTQCVVKYALKDCSKTSPPTTFSPEVCEPALGSGAFLNEAMNQLADAYLEHKQRETSRIIGHDEYLVEKQKVKAYLADNRVYGVDRNPVAIELAEISLWLNTIYHRHTIPWSADNSPRVTASSARAAKYSPPHSLKALVENGSIRFRIGSRWKGPRRGSDLALPGPGQGDGRLHRQSRQGDSSDRNEVDPRLAKGLHQAIFCQRQQSTERLSAAVDRFWEKHAQNLNGYDAKLPTSSHLRSGS